MTVNELIAQLHRAVDAEDRDHVEVRLVIHGYEDPTQTAMAEYTNAGTGYHFVNIIASGGK